jgi:hypothetical protein
MDLSGPGIDVKLKEEEEDVFCISHFAFTSLRSVSTALIIYLIPFFLSGIVHG